jgi:hypothetical protein
VSSSGMLANSDVRSPWQKKLFLENAFLDVRAGNARVIQKMLFWTCGQCTDSKYNLVPKKYIT